MSLQDFMSIWLPSQCYSVRWYFSDIGKSLKWMRMCVCVCVCAETQKSEFTRMLDFNIPQCKISYLPLRIMFAVGLSYIAFIMLRYVPSIPAFWGVFIINGCWILSKAFSASIEIIIWFLFFNLLMWCITLIDLQVLKNPCIPGIKPTLHSHQSTRGFLFSTPSPVFIICRLFNDGHSDQCEVVPHCRFDLHFSNNLWWASFHVLIDHLYVFRKMSI